MLWTLHSGLEPVSNDDSATIWMSGKARVLFCPGHVAVSRLVACSRPMNCLTLWTLKAAWSSLAFLHNVSCTCCVKLVEARKRNNFVHQHLQTDCTRRKIC